jgi:hypothetical protein
MMLCIYSLNNFCEFGLHIPDYMPFVEDTVQPAAIFQARKIVETGVGMDWKFSETLESRSTSDQ